MKDFLLARTAKADEWVLTECRDYEEPRDILVAEDGTPMRKVVTFAAPSWEEARELLLYCSQKLKRQTLSPHLTWEEAKLLMEGVNPNVIVAKKHQEEERSQSRAV